MALLAELILISFYSMSVSEAQDVLSNKRIQTGERTASPSQINQNPLRNPRPRSCTRKSHDLFENSSCSDIPPNRQNEEFNCFRELHRERDEDNAEREAKDDSNDRNTALDAEGQSSR
jgi:hypothetical protein